MTKNIMEEDWFQEMIANSINSGHKEITVGVGGWNLLVVLNYKAASPTDHSLYVVDSPRPFQINPEVESSLG